MDIRTKTCVRTGLASDPGDATKRHLQKDCDPDISKGKEILCNMPDPMTCPTPAANGRMEKPRAILLSSVISAKILFATPMFPFNAPFKKRL